MTASGVILLSHIIFSQAHPFGPYPRDGPDGALQSISENGYVDSQLLYAFINRLFIFETKQIPIPKLLVFDGHGSHLTMDAMT